MADTQPEIIQQLSVPVYAPRPAPLPIPAAAWDAAPLMCLEVNDEWVAHILGVLVAMDQPDTWIGTPDEIYAARQQVNQIMAAFMERCDPMSNCCPDPLIRITPDGNVEVSDDGGLSWHPATSEDPRNTAPQLAPLAGADGDEKKCTAANNVLGQFKDGVAAFSADFGLGVTLVEFVTAAAGFIAALIFAPAAIPLIVAIEIPLLSAIAAGGKIVYDAAFNDTVYGDLLCLLYSNVHADGSFTDANFTAIRAGIVSGFDPIPRDAFLALLQGVSLAGLNNLAKITSGTSANCDSCNTFCGETWAQPTGNDELIVYDAAAKTCTITALDGNNNNWYAFLWGHDDCCAMETSIIGDVTIYYRAGWRCDNHGTPAWSNEGDSGWAVGTFGNFSAYIVRGSGPFQLVCHFDA